MPDSAYDLAQKASVAQKKHATKNTTASLAAVAQKKA
jgi:hypothetical protein